MSDLGAWAPLRPEEVADLFADLEVFWCVAGGWAIDLFAGRQTRPHADTDVLALRPDVATVRAHMADWDAHMADPPGSLRPWPVDDPLPPRVHDIWCRRTPSDPWSLQLMVDEVDSADGTVWTSRRDVRIRRPVAEIWHVVDGLPVLVPEIQLLYKAKSPRPKDDRDFRTALPLLTPDQREWLDGALAVMDPGHSWRQALGIGG